MEIITTVAARSPSGVRVKITSSMAMPKSLKKWLSLWPTSSAWIKVFSNLMLAGSLCENFSIIGAMFSLFLIMLVSFFSLTAMKIARFPL
ncbi:hypothetical protein D9M69_727340 [compost metagenome]